MNRIWARSSDTIGADAATRFHVSARRGHTAASLVLGLFALTLPLVSCGGGGGGGGGGGAGPAPIPAPPPTTGGLMRASDWTIGPIINGKNYSQNVPLRPTQDADDWHIDLPPSDGVHYVTRPFGSLAGKTKITIRYRVEIADGAKIVPSTGAEYPSIGPTLYFQRAGDDWNTDGYRWWATFNAPMPIVAGTFEVSAPLDGPWTSVQTKTAAANPTDFANAKAAADQVGFTLGGGTGYGHGVYATGQARIVVTDFIID